MQELKVHHAAPDGLLLVLPSGEGFGSLSLGGLGGDALAARMLKHFATQDSVPCVLRQRRDGRGYLALSIDLTDLCTDVLTLARPLQKLLRDQFRKSVLCGAGNATSAKVARLTAQGLVLTLSNGMAAIALDKPEEPKGVAPPSSSSSSPTGPVTAAAAAGVAQVWVVDYDSGAGVVVTTLATATRQPPTDAAGWAACAGAIRTGMKLECEVLYVPAAAAPVTVPPLPSGAKAATAAKPTAGEGGSSAYAVVAVSVPQSHGVPKDQVLLGYVLLDDGSTDPSTAKPKVGAHLHAYVYYTPVKALQAATPFLVLGFRQRGAPPPMRTAKAATKLMALLPWRDESGAAESHLGGDARGAAEDPETAEPQLRRRRLEEAIDAYERDLVKLPTSAEDFTKLLLASPNSSYLWTQFMAFHTNLQQHEQARQVAEKALRTIGVRESTELLNVWVAYLNLENLHGTAESLTSIFRRATQHLDDPLLVHERLADIFQATGKQQQLLALCRVMTSKYRSFRRVWERLGCVLMDQNKRDQLKRVVKEMGDALSKADQCVAIEHIAIHEYKAGSVEHGRQLLESLIAKVPKKSDLWSAYLDQEMALLARKDPMGSVAGVRAIFERVATVSLPPRVMQQLLTRYLAFEQAHGTAGDVEKVKERARQYVESRLAVNAATGTATAGAI